MRLLFALSFSLVVASAATAASLSALKDRESRQLQTLHRDTGTIVFFKHHPRLLRGPTRRAALRALRFARAEIAWTRKELGETRAQMTVASWPPHHALWMCIHGHEAGDWQNQDTGHNGHYGGLQMHPGWGYGTSYYASSDSQWTQEWAAERGYQASGFSRAWLVGQWAHYDCASRFG